MFGVFIQLLGLSSKELLQNILHRRENLREILLLKKLFVFLKGLLFHLLKACSPVVTHFPYYCHCLGLVYESLFLKSSHWGMFFYILLCFEKSWCRCNVVKKSIKKKKKKTNKKQLHLLECVSSITSLF